MRAHALGPDLEMELFEIAVQMKEKNLPVDFIVASVDAAKEFEGIYDLMKLWTAESKLKEREAIIADIQDMLDDVSQQTKHKGVSIRFNDLEAVARDVRTFKDSLLEIVHQTGGITRLAELTHIPQPSLSRFFNTASMPRRTTLQKIARALKLDSVAIAVPWSR